jgi:hypothetical protein
LPRLCRSIADWDAADLAGFRDRGDGLEGAVVQRRVAQQGGVVADPG